jgi:regulator of replication initiation timing
MKFFNFEKKMTAEDVHTVAVQLTTMNKLLDRLIDENRELKRDINNVKTRIDEKVYEALDTVQKRYLTMLEGKLVQFDQEGARLKMDKEAEYQRLHNYFYSGGRP